MGRKSAGRLTAKEREGTPDSLAQESRHYLSASAGGEGTRRPKERNSKGEKKEGANGNIPKKVLIRGPNKNPKDRSPLIRGMWGGVESWPKWGRQGG